MSESFVMIKPDIFYNNAVRTEVEKCIRQNDLTISRRKNVRLGCSDVDALWRERQNDLVTNFVLKLYLVQKEIEIIYLEGEDAIEKTSRIKKYIRKKFAVSRYANCIHTPIDEAEYILQRDRLDLCTDEACDSFEYEPCMRAHVAFKKYEELDIARMLECAKYIWTNSNEIGWNNLYDRFQIKKKKYNLYLLAEERNTIIHVVACLYEYLSDWTLERAYISAFATEAKGSFCIMTGDRIEEVETMYHRLQNCGLDLKLE